MIAFLAELKCSKHPNYTGQRAPRTQKPCVVCNVIFDVRSLLTRHSKKYEIRHAPLENWK